MSGLWRRTPSRSLVSILHGVARPAILSIAVMVCMLESGCVMGVRKAIGTLQGPRSTIEVLEEHAPMPSGMKIGTIALATDGEGASDDERFSLFRSALVAELRAQDLYRPDQGLATLVITLLTDTRLPARQKIVVEVGVSAAAGEIGEARVTTDLQGLADRKDVVADMARSVVIFIQELRDAT